MRSLLTSTWVVLTLAFTAASCGRAREELEGLVAHQSQAMISDPVHSGGSAGFYFLPPLVDQPPFHGVFDPSLSPVVQIDRINPASGQVLRPVATFTRT